MSTITDINDLLKPAELGLKHFMTCIAALYYTARLTVARNPDPVLIKKHALTLQKYKESTFLADNWKTLIINWGSKLHAAASLGVSSLTYFSIGMNLAILTMVTKAHITELRARGNAKVEGKKTINFFTKNLQLKKFEKYDMSLPGSTLPVDKVGLQSDGPIGAVLKNDHGISLGYIGKISQMIMTLIHTMMLHKEQLAIKKIMKEKNISLNSSLKNTRSKGMALAHEMVGLHMTRNVLMASTALVFVPSGWPFFVSGLVCALYASSNGYVKHKIGASDDFTSMKQLKGFYVHKTLALIIQDTKKALSNMVSRKKEETSNSIVDKIDESSHVVVPKPYANYDTFSTPVEKVDDMLLENPASLMDPSGY